MSSTGHVAFLIRRKLGYGSHSAYMHTGEQQPPTEQKPCDGGMSTRSPESSGVCSTSAETRRRLASHSDGPEPTDWPYSTRSLSASTARLAVRCSYTASMSAYVFDSFGSPVEPPYPE